MFDKELLKIPGMKLALVALLASSLAQGLLTIGQVLALACAISELWAGSPFESQLALVGAFLGCFAARRIVSYVQDELLDRYSEKQGAALRAQLLDVVFSSRVDVAGNLGTAATSIAATENIDETARYIRILPPKLCGMLGLALPVLVALFATDWVSGVIAVVAFPVIMLFMIILGKQARARAERQFEANRILSNHFIDVLRGMQTIDALDAVESESESVFATSERLRASTVKTLSVATLSSAVLDLITVFGVAAVAMMLAFRLMDGSVDLTHALAALMLTPEFFAPIRSFATDFHASLDGKNALAAILGVLSAAPDIEPESEPFPTWTGESSLEVSGLAHRHGESSHEALSNVSLALHGFEKVALVGESGSGKSTLAGILAGFTQPTAGTFAVDGTSSNSLCRASWTNQVHFIPQNPYLFHATLEDNIRLYSPDASHEDVERVASIVGLDELVAQLPDGLDTVVGEGGRGLSGGQAHRIALARILLDDRKVLVFDEPTAHLDIETELEIKHRMLPCMQGKLVVFATHRLHWLADMDRVIVLENGSVAECGAPQELLERDGALRRFIDAQRAEVT